MCVTSHPAHLAKTKVGVLLNHFKGTHTLFYANTMQNLHTSANCMILPILGEITEITDTRPFGSFITEIIQQTVPAVRSFGGGLPKGVEIMDVGAYQVIISRGANAQEVMSVLEKMDEAKRPTISTELLEWYNEFYGNPNLAICCFNNSDEVKAQPMMITYKPRDFERFILPGADSHDGKVPQMGTNVDRDHTLFFGSIITAGIASPLQTVKFSQEVPKEIYTAKWMATPNMHGQGVNCDWLYQYDDNKKDLVWHGSNDKRTDTVWATNRLIDYL